VIPARMCTSCAYRAENLLLNRMIGGPFPDVFFGNYSSSCLGPPYRDAVCAVESPALRPTLTRAPLPLALCPDLLAYGCACPFSSPPLFFFSPSGRLRRIHPSCLAVPESPRRRIVSVIKLPDVKARHFRPRQLRARSANLPRRVTLSVFSRELSATLTTSSKTNNIADVIEGPQYVRPRVSAKRRHQHSSFGLLRRDACVTPD